MDIGTAKPSRDMQNKVKHWLIDIADPSEPYSAFRFSQDASAIIRQRARQGARTMICGGTGLYFQALHNGLGHLFPTIPPSGKSIPLWPANWGTIRF